MLESTEGTKLLVVSVISWNSREEKLKSINTSMRNYKIRRNGDSDAFSPLTNMTEGS